MKQARRRAAQYAEFVSQQTGKPSWVQILEASYLACVHSISPKSYYLFELYRREQRRAAHQYLHRYETKFGGVYSSFSCRPEARSRRLTDKVRFHRRCDRMGLPTIPILATAAGGEIETTVPHLPERDLFAKEARGRGGSGAVAWRWESGTGWVDSRGRSYREPQLVDELRLLSRAEPLILQPRMRNDRDVERLAGDVLATARVLTILDEAGNPEVTAATFRMSCGNELVDNMHRGGIAAPINIRTGELGAGVRLSPSSPRYDTHPDRGSQIKGHKLPGWRDAAALAVRAHVAFSDMLLVGWDIAFSSEGVLLVEGNSAPCVHLVQRPQAAPLGGTRFGVLLAHHLSQLESN